MNFAYVFEIHTEQDIVFADGSLEFVKPKYVYDSHTNQLVENTDENQLRMVAGRKDGRVLVPAVRLGEALAKKFAAPHDCLVECA